MVQEALTNILKHALASSASLIIEHRLKEVRMIIEDNGVGFDVATTQLRAQAEQRLGLIGMEERVAQLGGILTIESAPQHGTTIFVRIPLNTDLQEGTR
ncbi:MAG: hypothetical protein HC794_05880 [Nitrospiraceae bacterium]|nr:hypothetical protein [Nitrospiraceae bacterium]